MAAGAWRAALAGSRFAHCTKCSSAGRSFSFARHLSSRAECSGALTAAEPSATSACR